MNFQPFHRPSVADLLIQLVALINTLDAMEPDQAANALERYPGLAALRDQIRDERLVPPEDRVAVSAWIRTLQEDCVDIPSSGEETTSQRSN